MHDIKEKGSSSISEYQISNVKCFEYPISSQLYGECQIANVQYQKTVQIHIQILRFGFVFSFLTMHSIKAKGSMCLFHQYLNIKFRMSNVSNIQ